MVQNHPIQRLTLPHVSPSFPPRTHLLTPEITPHPTAQRRTSSPRALSPPRRRAHPPRVLAPSPPGGNRCAPPPQSAPPSRRAPLRTAKNRRASPPSLRLSHIAAPAPTIVTAAHRSPPCLHCGYALPLSVTPPRPRRRRRRRIPRHQRHRRRRLLLWQCGGLLLPCLHQSPRTVSTGITAVPPPLKSSRIAGLLRQTALATSSSASASTAAYTEPRRRSSAAERLNFLIASQTFAWSSTGNNLQTFFEELNTFHVGLSSEDAVERLQLSGASRLEKFICLFLIIVYLHSCSEILIFFTSFWNRTRASSSSALCGILCPK
ncbi:uncharacterized protein [Oryza sativa Japonica Group]|uniref:uncharacterized protein n=1 Tax=Oryza sativa subsp. japonica TaxID=39947 RepID=UPI00339CA545